MHLHATSWSNDIIREMNCWFIVNFTVIFRLLYNIYMYKVVKLHQLSCIGLLIERADDSKYSFCYMFSSIHGCKF